MTNSKWFEGYFAAKHGENIQLGIVYVERIKQNADTGTENITTKDRAIQQVKTGQ